MKGEDREDKGMEQFQERELLCQAGTGIRPLERKEGAYVLLTSLHMCHAAPAPCQPRVGVPRRAALAVPLDRGCDLQI